MADTTIFNLTATTTLADSDVIPVVDVSDTAQSAQGSTRKATLANFKTYISASPTLVTPALGTPSSGTLTNCTGLPTTGIVDAAVTLAKMANLAQDQFIGRTTASTGVPQTATITAAARTVLDDTTVAAMVDTLGGASSTGTGGIARATSPTFVTPALGAATATSINGLTITTSTGTLTVSNGKTASFSNTLTFTGTDSSSIAFGTGGTVAYANSAVTLSSSTDLTRASHGNRRIVCDTGGITLTILDDTAGGWGSGDVVYGINTSTGNVTIAADATGTTNTVTATPGNTLTVYPGQEFAVSRNAANVWTGGAEAPDVLIIPIGDETTAITTGTAKVTFRFPYAGRLVDVRGSLTTASSSGTPTFDLNEGGTTMLSTKLTIDANELTSTTAASAAVISDAAFADDAQATIDVDTAGTGAAGAKIALYILRGS